MKVIVRCANNRVTKADMEREIERLFQENKDLRLSESHLRDELNLSQQQSEARRQVICERDKLIQELNDQIAADEYRIAAMESDYRVDECEKRMDWLSKEVLEWKATAEGYKNQYEELKAQKEADDKKSEEICTACNERYENVLAERNLFAQTIARLTTERDTSVSENSELIFTINELQDKWEAEHNLRVEAEKAYDKVASEAYDMHQQVTNLTVDNTRLENKVEELEDEVDTCHHNIDGYIEGNRRMRAEYEKKLETGQDQTKHWRKKHDEVLQKMEGYKIQLIIANEENLARAEVMEQMQEEHNELEENFNELERVHKLWGEEIDRLRKVVIDLQTNRFTTDEFIGMLVKNFMPSADK